MPNREAVSRSIARRLRAPGLLIGGDVGSAGSRRSALDKLGAHAASSAASGMLQAVLVLRAADAILDRQILHRLHVQRDARAPWRAAAADGG